MARHRSGESYLEANVWPAVTDTMILMASIFIVLSVVSMVALSRKIDESLGEGQESGEKIAYITYKIRADLLFQPGEDQFKSLPRARNELLSILRDAGKPKNLQELRNFARAQKTWSQQYYLVMEVAGHADCDPLDTEEPGRDNNWDLSARRATRVVHTLEDLLREQAGLRQDLGFSQSSLAEATMGSTILRASGYSNHLPSKSYQGPKARQEEKNLNRRVEIRIFAQPAFALKLTK